MFSKFGTDVNNRVLHGSIVAESLKGYVVCELLKINVTDQHLRFHFH